MCLSVGEVPAVRLCPYSAAFWRRAFLKVGVAVSNVERGRGMSEPRQELEVDIKASDVRIEQCDCTLQEFVSDLFMVLESFRERLEELENEGS